MITLDPIHASQAARLAAFMQAHYPPAYAYLWRDAAAWYLANEYEEERLRHDLTKPSCTAYWLRDTTGAVLGWTQWERRPAPDRTDAGAYLHRLYLATAAQGRGAGALTMDRFHAWARGWGAPYCWLESMTLGRSRKFYARQGYVPTGEIQLTYPPMHDGLRGLTRMVRQLT